MQTISIEILNPKAKKLLQNLADLNLISIIEKGDSKNKFKSLLKDLRKNSLSAPALDEITKEVETVRQKRYGR